MMVLGLGVVGVVVVVNDVAAMVAILMALVVIKRPCAMATTTSTMTRGECQTTAMTTMTPTEGKIVA